MIVESEGGFDNLITRTREMIEIRKTLSYWVRLTAKERTISTRHSASQAEKEAKKTTP
jgi:hypothetical protein